MSDLIMAKPETVATVPGFMQTEIDHQSSTSGKGKYDPPAGERIYLLHAMQAAIVRSRLTTNTLESINVAPRHRSITVDQAMHWLPEEGCLHLIKFPAGGNEEQS